MNAKKQTAEIRRWLKENGFTKAIGENVTVDGVPAVALRWNGKQHEITLYEIESLYDNDYRSSWLDNNFADQHLDDSREWKRGNGDYWK